MLIDGKRVPAGAPLQGGWATNINAIPSTLIQRIEVLSGGASSIYGSDAVAGVVNFIMNDHFEGVQLDWNYSGYNHQQNSWMGELVGQKERTNPAQFHVPGDQSFDGNTQNFSVTMGSNFANGKGNATIFFEYRRPDPLLQSERDYSACSLSPAREGQASTASNPVVKGYVCGGSGTSYPGTFGGPTLRPDHDRECRRRRAALRHFSGSIQLRADQLLPAPRHALPLQRVRALRRAAAGPGVRRIRLHERPNLLADRSQRLLLPDVHASKRQTRSCPRRFKDAAGITPGVDQHVYIGRRNIEGGGRQDNFTFNNFRIVLGAKGSFYEDKWDYNAWWQSGRNSMSRQYLNDFSVSRLGKAFNVVTSPTTGAPVCASVVDGTDPLCVPYDIFHIGGVTQAALNYLQTPGMQTGYTAQSVVGVNVTSDLGSSYGWTLPWAKDGVGVAVGIERRVEKLSNSVDAEFATGDLAGQGGATLSINGQFTRRRAVLRSPRADHPAAGVGVRPRP